MIKSEELAAKMNRAQEGRVPFLFALDYEMEKALFIEHPLGQQEVLWRVGEATNAGETPPFTQNIFFKKRALPYTEYARRFSVIMEGLKRGDSFLANLTVRTPVETNCPLSEIFYRSTSPYALFVPGKFVCFSPETFVTMEKGRIYSFPMKGTINAELADARETLMADPKESAEHFTVVDLLRSDLSRVAHRIRVDRFRYLDRVKTSDGSIYQASSQISGDLLDVKIGDALLNLLPAGSITGAPKPRTVSLIAEAEGEKRGFYCGVMGYFDGERLDSAVLIRFIEAEESADGTAPGALYFRSGGGITINSDCRSEYEEVLEKVYLPFKI